MKRQYTLWFSLLASVLLGACDDTSEDAPPTTEDAAPADATGTDVGPADGALCVALSDATADALLDAAATDAMPDATPPELTYADLELWLCHPDLDEDICRAGLDATIVAADGTLTPAPHAVAEAPAVDCFYVYPTTSLDGGSNADRLPNVEERFIVHEHAGPFSQLCRVFAPVYRQVTITGLIARNAADFAFAYADVKRAWQQYRADNPNRPVILIGHSQGAAHLRTLIAQEIDGDADARGLMVSAYLIGNSVGVPRDGDIGGTFGNVPLCTAPDQHGCVVSYATYRASVPPEPGALFGGPVSGGLRSACVNPAALGGDPTRLDALFPVEVMGFYAGFMGSDVSPFADPDGAPVIPTPHFKVPGLLSAECVTQGQFDYLELTVNADPEDPRADDIIGDLTTGWGLHLVDLHLVMGDLLRLSASQFAAWQADR
ncbi:MAG: hypothetical protein ACI9U2_000227 [Bradymonadia bacterium]|jgi:hypothetical protein